MTYLLNAIWLDSIETFGNAQGRVDDGGTGRTVGDIVAKRPFDLSSRLHTARDRLALGVLFVLKPQVVFCGL